MGDIMGTLIKNRSRILGMEPMDGLRRFCEAPWWSCQSTLRATIHDPGGKFTMEFAVMRSSSVLSEKIIEKLQREKG